MIIRSLFVFIWRSILHSFDWLGPYLIRMEFHQQLAIQITLGAILTLSILSTATYLAIRWMGWRSLVIFLVTPAIWLVLALYSNSLRLFWKKERIATQSDLLPLQ